MRKFILAVILITTLHISAFADVIHIKDGGKIEGIIQEETEEEVVVDMGFGTITLNRNDIERIEEATPQQFMKLKQRKLDYEIERGDWAPPGYDHIRNLYRTAKEEKNVLVEARMKSYSIKTEIGQKEKRVQELLGLMDKRSQELNSIEAKSDVRKYNAIVAQINSISSHLNKETSAIKALYAEERDANLNLAKLSDKYRSSVHLFKDALHKQKSDVGEDMGEEEAYFVESMEGKAGEMEADFKKDVTTYTAVGNQVIVATLINDTAYAQLLLDTGASMVAISTDVASRLGINYDSISTEIECIMADGSVSKAKPVILQSVKVGDAEVKNVQAAILATDVIGGGVDGLLGMSYLNNFVIKVDSANNKLILERVL